MSLRHPFVIPYIPVIMQLLLFSCGGAYHDQQLLHEAGMLSDSLPADALRKLQAVSNSRNFTRSDQAKYGLLLTRTMLMTGNRPPSDSLVSLAVARYRETNDSIALFDALYTKAMFFFSTSAYDSALHYFAAAENVIPPEVSHNKRIRVQRMSGYANLYLGRTKAAVKNYRTVLGLLDGETNAKAKVYVLLDLAQAYKYDHAIEEALNLCREALALAEKNHAPDQQSVALSRLSDLYAGRDDFKKALRYKKQEHALRVNREEIPTRNLSQAMLFDKQNQPDSARYYLEQALQGNDHVVADIAYGFLCDWYEKQGLHDKAFGTLRKKQETTRHLESNIRMTALERRYESERLKNENNRLKIEQKEKDILLLVVLLVVFAVSVSLFFVFWRQKKNRQALRLQAKTRELEHQNVLLKQQQEISALREKEALLRESLFRRIHFFHRIPSLHIHEENVGEQHETLPDTGNKIRMKETDWAELTRSVNEVYPGFIEQLKTQYPSLTDDDLYFCCFVKMRVNLQDLSDIYCITKSAVTKRKYRLKTDKFKITEKHIDLDTFLQDQ